MYNRICQDCLWPCNIYTEICDECKGEGTVEIESNHEHDKYEMKDGSFSLFKNDKKLTEKHPDYKGSIKINGVEHWFDAWLIDGERDGHVPRVGGG